MGIRPAEVHLGLVDNHRQLAAHQGVEVDLAVLGLAIDHAGDPATVVVLARFPVEKYLAGFAHADGAQVLAHVLAIVPVQHDLDAFDILQGGDLQLGLLAHPDLGDHADLNGVGLCSKGEAAQQQEEDRNQEALAGSGRAHDWACYRENPADGPARKAKEVAVRRAAGCILAAATGILNQEAILRTRPTAAGSGVGAAGRWRCHLVHGIDRGKHHGQG
jgi:hypothetical protein